MFSKDKSIKILICRVLVIITTLVIIESKKLTASGREYSINLKSRVIVIGPMITLGDIGQVVERDSATKILLSAVKIIEAPPPGETTEISINFIKRCLITAGLRKYTSSLKGPKVVRVTTAQVEIDKAFLIEEFASANGFKEKFRQCMINFNLYI